MFITPAFAQGSLFGGAGGDGGMLMSHDEDEKRTLQVTVGKSSGGGSTIGLTFGEKR